MACQETNRVDGSSIRPPVSKLCQVASCMNMLFRDTWSLSVWDDMLIVGHGKSIIKRLKKGLGSQFSMKDLGPTQQILGINYISRKNGKWILAHEYIWFFPTFTRFFPIWRRYLPKFARFFRFAGDIWPNSPAFFRLGQEMKMVHQIYG